MEILVADKPEDIDNWLCANRSFTGHCDGCDHCKMQKEKGIYKTDEEIKKYVSEIEEWKKKN